MTTELCRLAQKYNVDKCPKVDSKYPTHTYTPEYDSLLSSRKHNVTNMLEIGIGNIPLMSPILNNYVPGASLRMWQDYFPRATIFACDIERDVLINDSRIKSFYCDQNSVTSLLDMYEQTRAAGGETQFDFILDDGSHQKEHQLTSFLTLWNFVKPSGIYIIEDVHATHLDYFASMPTTFGITNATVVKIHKGAWGGDNFIAFQKLHT
jgi:hypothetical protein